MRDSVVGAGFAFGIAVFVAWLTVMLRLEKARRATLTEASHERTRAHRRAALAARHDPTPQADLPVVRAGSFCRVLGNVACTKTGTVLVCQSSGSGRPRWRRAEVLPAAS